MKIDGKKLRDIRKSKGMTQTDLCSGICSASHISLIEQGKKTPTHDVAEALIARLEVKTEMICVSEEPEQTSGTEVAVVLPDRLVPMNRNERNNWLFINAFVHKLGQVIEEFKIHNADPKMVKKLDDGMISIASGMADRLRQVEPKSIKNLNRESYLLDVALAHRRDAQRYYDKFYEEDRQMRKKANEDLGGDPISDLAEITLLAACQVCNGDPCKSKKGCLAFRALSALNIPAWDEENSKCVYAGSGLMPGSVGA